ncbi:metallophosphoesterase family protein [Priestia aryabhattai]|uniref:metallophosphoesterase family protein n=1 Tax=Priestia aryabhattai TaxID=412384 RepID=UPI0035324E92
MEIYLTSDTHFDHKNIIDYEKRPFEDNLQMTEVLIDKWNSVVKPNDLIFHLGDVFFCKAARMKEIADRLNGRKILIRGNHDKGYSNGKFNKLGFDVYNYYLLEGLFLSHYPQDESAIAKAIDEEMILGNVHGHVHSQIEGLDERIYKCVSVELTDYKPIHIDEVKQHFTYSDDILEF